MTSGVSITIIIILLLNFNFAYSSNQSEVDGENPRAYVKSYSSYLDLDKNIIVTGSVAKSDYQIFPQIVTIGMKVYNNLTNNHEILTEKPYNSILYNNNEPFPFKFELNSTKYSLTLNSKPFIYKSENVSLPFTKLNTFKLDYPVIPQGKNKELFGNITNTSPIQIENITLFAIVNDKNSTQIDSAKTFIPILRPYETIEFTFSPNSAIKDQVYFYSCVGGNVDDMKIDEYKIVNLSPSKVLGYKFSGLIQIDSMNYDKNSKQFNFKINNIYPYPGSLSLELMPAQTNYVSAYMDGTNLQSTYIKNMENKTQIELSIPQGIHEVVISNIEG